jgi:putative inorganic carbon (hco3(-)) transporter
VSRTSPITATIPAVYSQPRRATLAYQALLFFTVIYFLRPEDFIPGLAYIPMGKISGGIALLALFIGFPSKDRPKFPLEIKVLFLLLGHMVLSTAFSFWIGGSARVVFNDFSKAVIVAVLVVLAVSNLGELRKLLYTQAAAVALVAAASLLVHHTDEAGRLMGLQKGFLENPNDLAINIAINFPLCVAFLLEAKGGRKVLWVLGLAFMMYGVVATYSRSGMVALAITALICIWEFGIKARRTAILAGTVLVALMGAGVMVVQPHYLARLETLVKGGDVEGAGDRGSLEARSQLLKEAVSLTLQHPVFGVGPGSFQVVTDEWRVVHNTYAELGAETGLPGLILFVAILVISFRKLRQIRKLPGYQANPEIRLWTGALWAGLAAYATGSLFASTEYNLFPYFVVGYISVLYRVADKLGETAASPASADAAKEIKRDGRGKRELAWSP